MAVIVAGVQRREEAARSRAGKVCPGGRSFVLSLEEPVGFSRKEGTGTQFTERSETSNVLPEKKNLVGLWFNETRKLVMEKEVADRELVQPCFQTRNLKTQRQPQRSQKETRLLGFFASFFWDPRGVGGDLGMWLGQLMEDGDST